MWFKWNPTKILTKTLLSPRYNMRNVFYNEVICNLAILDGNVDLLLLEKCLEKRLKIFFNPVANIIATQGTKSDNEHQNKDKERKQNNSFHNSTPQSLCKRKTLLKHLFATYFPRIAE